MENSNYGVIGNPIAHSKSPIIHNFWYQSLNINANYSKILVETKEDLKSSILNYQGVNITVPYKEEVYKIADIISDEVKLIKASNTIINNNGTLKAFNTDAFGFLEPLKNYKINSALLIGAGGAARAVCYALMQENIRLKVVNRSPRSDFLCEVQTSLDEFSFDLVINATNTSLNDILPLDENTLIRLSKNAKIFYDLAYLHDIFLDFAKSQNPNIITIDGSDMLIYQAALAFKYFCGIYPSEELINAAKELIR